MAFKDVVSAVGVLMALAHATASSSSTFPSTLGHFLNIPGRKLAHPHPLPAALTPPPTPPPVVTPATPTPAVIPNVTAPALPLQLSLEASGYADGAADEAYFAVKPGECPGPITAKIGAGQGSPQFNIKDKASKYYEDRPEIETLMNGKKIKLDYAPITNGGTYCHSQGKDKVMIGGTLLFSKGGKCFLPPTTTAGEPCCTLHTWQPNSDGYYYNDCSMSLKIGAKGVWFFYTEMPGDESVAGWGPDPEPHLHYDLRCKGCAGDVFGTTFNYWNKYYPETLCPASICGQKIGPVHQASEKELIGDTMVYTYHFVMDAENSLNPDD